MPIVHFLLVSGTLLWLYCNLFIHSAVAMTFALTLTLDKAATICVQVLYDQFSSSLRQNP